MAHIHNDTYRPSLPLTGLRRLPGGKPLLAWALCLLPLTCLADNYPGHPVVDNMDSAAYLAQDGQPISVPVKALVERFALGVSEADYAARKFRYDIDTLGQGMALRMRYKF